MVRLAARHGVRRPARLALLRSSGGDGAAALRVLRRGDCARAEAFSLAGGRAGQRMPRGGRAQGLRAGRRAATSGARSAAARRLQPKARRRGPKALATVSLAARRMLRPSHACSPARSVADRCRRPVGPDIARPLGTARILVVPFENAAQRAAISLARRSVAPCSWPTASARGACAISRAERVRAFEELHLPLSASLSRATVIKVGQIARRRGSRHRHVSRRRIASSPFEAHTIRVDAGRCGRASPSGASSPSSSHLTIGWSGRRRAGVGAAAAAPGSSAARRVRELHQGAASRRAPRHRRRSSRRRSSDYPGVRPGAPGALGSPHRSGRSRGGARGRAGRSARPRALSPARGFCAGVSLLELKRYDEAFETFDGARCEDRRAARPRQPDARRRPTTTSASSRSGAAATPQTGTAVYYLTKATEADPGDPGLPVQPRLRLHARSRLPGRDLLAAGGAAPRSGGRRRALRARRGARRRAGSTVEAGRERELARQLSSRYEELERRARPTEPRCRAASSACAPIRTARGRCAPTRRSSARRSASSASWRTFHLERGRRLFEREQDREAIAELRRAVYLSPYEAQAHLLIGRIYLRGGRPARGGRRAEDLDLERGHRRRRTSRSPRRT